jgi:hypothetical protein
MRRFQALTIIATVLVASSCGAAEPIVTADANRPAASDAAVGRTEADGGESLEEKFERYVCGDAPACEAQDISDHSLDYGDWLASSLGVAPLSRLHVLDSFYIEAGPGKDGESLALGAVSFLSSDADQTQAIVAQLAAIPDGAFKDGKVIMRFKPLVDGDRIDLVFTDSFAPRMDRFLGSI